MRWNWDVFWVVVGVQWMLYLAVYSVAYPSSSEGAGHWVVQQIVGSGAACFTVWRVSVLIK